MPVKSINSRVDISAGIVRNRLLEKPNITFIHERKKKVGPNRYKKTNKNTAANGNKSRKNEKNKNSETKKIDPGKPKKINMFSKTTKKSLGVK
jgi:hypothetical protein